MNSKLYFALLIGSTMAITLLSNITLNLDELLLNSLSEHLTKDQINESLKFNEKWKWLGYFLVPLFLFIKVNLVGAVIYMGLFLFNKEIAYKSLFTIVVKAEFVFTCMALVKLIWFSFQEQYTLEDVQFFYPLSAVSIIGKDGIAPWFIYPFQTLNLFELIYWLALAYLLGREIRISTEKALKIVASSYGPALLIWVVAIMFFTLNAN